MGSCVSIGFVYEKSSIEKIENELKKLVKYVCTANGRIKKIKICMDIDGEEWAEYDSIQWDGSYTILAKYFYGQLEIDSSLLGCDSLCVTIRIEKDKEEDYFGFLLDMAEEELIKITSEDEINYITEKIINFIIEFYNYSRYDYAFCDNEAEIQYSPNNFRASGNCLYSIAVIPAIDGGSNIPNVIKSNWNIDGLTIRK